MATARTLAHRIQFQIGIVIAVVIVAVTLLAYQFSIASMRKDTLDNLLTFVSLRSTHDSAAFVEAQRNAATLRDEYLRRLALAGNQDPRQEFDSWFVRYPDGLIRVRPERDDFQHLPSIYIRASVAVTPDIRRQVVVAFRLLREWGPVLTQNYYSAYIDLPAVALIMYSPSVNWGKEADTNTNNFDYPPVQNSSPLKNPLRNNLWTEVYFDDKARISMVSTITPADQGRDWIGTVSQDVAVDELVKRTVNEQMPGTYNLILDEAGHLLAHPERCHPRNSTELRCKERGENPRCQCGEQAVASAKLRDFPRQRSSGGELHCGGGCAGKQRRSEHSHNKERIADHKAAARRNGRRRGVDAEAISQAARSGVAFVDSA